MADVPSVAVDIAPLHSIVARVMDGVGTPDLIIPPGASPHEYNLKPSEAKALQDADLVFWIGEDLTPWLEGTIETLATDASVTALLDADGTVLLDFREDALFEAHDHSDHEGHDEHDDHAEDKHDDHDHDDHAEDKHDEHGEEKHDDHDDHADHDEHGHDDHGHGEHDPHAWLSPENAAKWANVIAAQLSTADPANAGTYFANAAMAQVELNSLQSEVSRILDPVRGKRFIVFHDAYQYFETSFDFPASGAISLSDASDPSPARIAEIQQRVSDQGIECVLSEPQFNPGLIATVMDGADAETGVLDPLGATLDLGPDMYPQLINDLATVLAECLN
jgi:zinc transport system substrate-binding protein